MPTEALDSDTADATPGRIGRYLVLGRLGAGGMGVVYAAYDPQLDRRVAVKVLRAEAGATPSGEGRPGQLRLLREAQAMAQLAHPHVIPVYDVGRTDEGIFFAMERVDGGTLRDWMAAPGPGRRRWREAVALFTQAGRGLAAAHAAGIVHRDFKPENVLIGSDGRLRVTDFGVARLAAEGGATAESGSGSGRTRSGSAPIIGTPGYLAPEQLDGVATAASDQFAFCVALYEGLCGQRPFTRAGFAAYAEELRDKPAAFPPRTPVPRFVREVVLRGLEKDPARRFPSMVELLAALGRDPRARRLRLVATVAVLAVAALAGGRLLVERAQHQRACARQAERAAVNWQRQRPQVAATFTGTGQAFARDALRTVERVMERFVGDWRQARGGICRGETALPAAARPAAAACLDETEETFEATTRLLAGGDADVVRHAPAIVGSLPPVAGCLDAAALESAPAPPEDPQVAARVAALRARLAAAKVLGIPRPLEGIAAIRPIVRELEALGHAPSLAEAHYELGDAQYMADLLDADAAPASLARAAELALGGRHDRLFIRAASRLTFVIGRFPEQRGRAGDWLALARRTYERAGRPPALGPWLDLQEVSVYIGAGRWAECTTLAERAAAGAARIGDAFQEAEASYLVAFCGSYSRPPAQVVRDSEAALERYLRLFGPEHPDTANVMGGVATDRWMVGDLAGAQPLREQSLRVTRAIGQPTLQLASALESEGKILQELGRTNDALASRREAWSILGRVPHPPRSRITQLAGLADSERQAGLKAAAWKHARQAVAGCEGELGERFKEACAHGWFVLAQLQLDRGQRAAAARHAARAVDGYATLPIAGRFKAQVEDWARREKLTLAP